MDVIIKNNPLLPKIPIGLLGIGKEFHAAEK
jgi:hypothetical protein